MLKQLEKDVILTCYLMSLISLPEKYKSIIDEDSYEKPSLMQKSKCWVCGLYQSESKFCLTCDNFNPWTLNKIFIKSLNI